MSRSMKTLALAISGSLAAPMAMAACDSQFDRLEERVESANMAQENETVLMDWLKEQRAYHNDATMAECTNLAAEIERQMVQKGYFAQVSQSGQPQSGQSQTAQSQASQPGQPTQDITMDQASIAIDAPPADVVVEQPPARINVQQQPADVSVQMESPQIMVQVPEPKVRVTQPPPQVTVNQPDPNISVQQADPVVSIQQPDPKVSVTQGEPEVQVRQGEPDVTVHDSPAIVDVQQGEPQVEVEQGKATVAVKESRTAQQSDISSASNSVASSERSGASSNAFAQGSGTSAAGQASGMPARELVGLVVVDGSGREVGKVAEVLKQPDTRQLYVRIDVDESRGLDEDEVVLQTAALERDNENLQVRGDGERVLRQGANVSSESLVPAGSETVYLAAGTD